MLSFPWMAPLGALVIRRDYAPPALGCLEVEGPALRSADEPLADYARSAVGIGDGQRGRGTGGSVRVDASGNPAGFAALLGHLGFGRRPRDPRLAGLCEPLQVARPLTLALGA